MNIIARIDADHAANQAAAAQDPRLTTQRTAIVNTYDLKAGDVVATHGEVFRLTERLDFSDCTAFRTEHMGHTSECRSMPADWRKDWTIQGNDRAFWTRVNVVAAA